MRKLKQIVLVYGMVLLLIVGTPITAMAGNGHQSNGQPFKEMWEELEDVQLEIRTQTENIDDLQKQLDTKTADRIAADRVLKDQIDGLDVRIDDLENQTGSNTVNQLLQDFVVASGKNVNAGDVVSFYNGYVQKWKKDKLIDPGSEYVFNSAGTEYASAAALTSDKFVVTYEDWDNSGYGTAVIGDVSGKTITFGSEYVFNSDWTYDISAVALSSYKFVVAYMDAGNSDYGTAVIGDVSGKTITLGSEYVFNSDGTEYASAAALTSYKFVVVYSDDGNSDYGTAVIGDVSGRTITFGSEYVFNAGSTYGISAAALTSDKFVAAYADADYFGYGIAVVGDVSGNTITFGSELVFNSGATQCITVAALSSDKLVVAYQDFDNSLYGTAIIGDVSSKVITYGSEYVFNSASTYDISAAALSSDKFVVTYQDWGNSFYGTAVIGDVLGSTITFGSEYVFGSAAIYYISAAALASDKFVVAYMDWDNSGYGTAVIGDCQEGAPAGSQIVGIAKESKTAGQTVIVIIDGVSDVHSNLILGAIYYLDGFGTLTTDITPQRIGLAISSTEILLADPFF